MKPRGIINSKSYETYIPLHYEENTKLPSGWSFTDCNRS